MRLFIAIELPAAIRKTLLACQPQATQNVRLVRPDQMHLTLHFVGEADAGLIEQSLTDLRASRFQLCLHSPGRFQDRHQQSTLWVGVQQNDDLLALHQAIGQRLMQTSITVETRRYTPHITLARCKRAVDSSAIQDFLAQTVPLQCFPVNQFSLYRSDLDSNGAHYRIIQRYALI